MIRDSFIVITIILKCNVEILVFPLIHNPSVLACVYVIIVTQAQVLSLICTYELEGMQRPKASADISGKARVPVLQLICYTSGKATVFIS